MSDKSKPPLAHLGQASNPDAARIEHWRDAALGSYVLVNAARERAEQLEAENARLAHERDAAIALADDLREDADADQANLAELNRLLYRLQHEAENLRQHVERLVKESQRRHRHCCGHDHEHHHEHRHDLSGAEID